MIRYDEYYKLRIEEPSDLCFSETGTSLFVVSDRQGLFEIDLNGEIIHSYLSKEYDLEAVCLWSKDTIVAADENNNDLLFFSTKPLSFIGRKPTNIDSKTNSGLEAICRLEENHTVLFQEKKPVKAFFLNDDFQITNSIKVAGISDISGVCYFKDYLWILSDEDASIYRANTKLSEIRKICKLPFSGAEGIAISSRGDLYIVSDSTEMLYLFKDFIRNFL